MSKASSAVLGLLLLLAACQGRAKPIAPTPSAGQQTAAAGGAAPIVQTVRVRGTLTDSAGAPLARVRVLALAPSGRGLFLAETGPDGSFNLMVPPGPVHLETRAAGWVSRAIDLTAPAEAPAVVLAKGLAITGTVVDAEGLAIAGALVVVRREAAIGSVKARRLPPATLGVWRDAELASARSNARGAYRVTGLAPAFYRLGAEATGFAPVEVRHVLAPSEDMLIALVRRLALAGRVIDAAGAPVSGAHVEVAGSGLWPAKLVDSDAKGRFVVDGLMEGIYEARARRGLAEASVALEGIERFGRSSGDEVVLQLGLAREVVARVVEASSGSPVVNAQVSLAADTLAALADRASSDASGLARLPPLPAGSYVASVNAQGYLPVFGQRVVVPSGEGPFELELRVARGAAIAGTVVDVAGTPVRGARIDIVVTDASGLVVPLPGLGQGAGAAGPGARFRAQGELGVLAGPIPYPPPRPAGVEGAAAAAAAAAATTGAGAAAGMGLTDAEGKFLIEGLPAGKARVTAMHPDYADSASADLVLLATARQQVILRLSPGAEVSGRVTDEGGSPLMDVLVTASPEGGTRGLAADITDGLSDDDLDNMEDLDARAIAGGQLAVLTDADGRYVIRPPVGVQRLEASKLHFTSATRVLKLGRAESEHGATVTADFVLSGADRQVEGRVIDRLGFGVAGARVRLVVAGQKARGKGVASDASGRFVLPRLGRPPYVLDVSHPDYPEHRSELTSTEAHPEIVLSFGGGISGRVLDARLRGPLSGVRVRLRGADGATRDTRPDARGMFELVRLSAGEWTVTASAPGHAPAVKTVRIEEGTRRPREVTLPDVELELTLAARISGRVLDDRGEPVANAEVKLAQHGILLASPRARSGADGTYVLEPVLEGDYDVRADTAGGSAEASDVRVRAGDDRGDVILRPR